MVALRTIFQSLALAVLLRKNNMLEKKLHDLIEPAIRAMGFELWACDCRQQAHQTLLRIYIDRSENQGVTLNDCALISREVGAVLDVEDPITQRYQLEVSSPGMDRVLLTPSHFARYVGHEVKIKLRVMQAGRRQFAARIDKVEADKIFLVVDNETIKVTLGEIQKANLIVR